ncbi:MAG: UvrD-helicase domain-containing protein, partial [bacterium]
MNKDKIYIFTIDSFINQIFQKAIAPYLGVYDYQIIEETENEEIIRQVFKELLDNPRDFALMEQFLSDNVERNVDNYIKLIKNMLNNRWKFILIQDQKRKKIEITGLTTALDECLEILQEIAVVKEKKFDEDLFVKDFQNMITDYYKLENKEFKKEYINKNRQNFFKNSFWHGNKVRGKAVADLKANMEESYGIFKEKLAIHFYNKEIIPYEQEILKFSSRIFDIYDRLKLRKKMFTHHDLSNYTYKYLSASDLNLLEDRELYRYFQDLLGTGARHLFIDEFQDTSILQWKILKPLIDTGDRIIIVGDEKQSIYGWRGGEKELFSGLDEILDGETDTLKTCYRSHREIIKFVNRFFKNLEIDWSYNQVSHLPQKNEGYVEVLLGGESALINTNTKTFDGKSEEMQEKIKKFNEKVKTNLKREISLTIKEKFAPDYSNIAVLARKNDDLEEIAAELDKRKIPYILESQDCIVEHQAVKPLYFLLRYLKEKDFFQLLEYLRSQLVGINEKQLKWILNHKKIVVDFMKAVTVSERYRHCWEQITAKHPQIAKVLQEIKEKDQLDYLILTESLLRCTPILSLYEDNNGAIKNLYRFFKLMRKFDSLGKFINYIEENPESDELKQVGAREDKAVQLMTIHKAKGLDFETEFFYWQPDSGRRNNFNEMKAYIEFDDTYEKVEDYLLTNTKYKRICEHLDITFMEKEERKNLMEEINNIYVALTRPQRNLFLYIDTPRKIKLDGNKRSWAGSEYYGFYEKAILNALKVDSLKDLITKKSFGELKIITEKDEERYRELPEIDHYFKNEQRSREELKKIEENKNLEMNLEIEIKRIEGLAIHYYLEHVKYDEDGERDYARSMVLSRYGNILGPQRTEKLLQRIENFID